MDTKDIIKATESTKRLVQDEQYYKYIFKKTERIVSVVFYIAYHTETNSKNKSQIEDVLASAKTVHDRILQSLEMYAHTAEDSVRGSAHALIALDSKLRVAQMSKLVADEVARVLLSEIDTVLRGINQYLSDSEVLTLLEDDTKVSRKTEPSTRPKEARDSTGSTSKTESERGGGLSRRERIRTVLEARGESTIRDIAEIITDCSEKTIQRELNSMIEDSLVMRQGERRWSKYSLV